MHKGDGTEIQTWPCIFGGGGAKRYMEFYEALAKRN